jgi:hypothetical protein
MNGKRGSSRRERDELVQTEVRITEACQQTLEMLCKQTGKSAPEILDAALEDYRRRLFLEAVNAGYAEMCRDPDTWADELAERKIWDATLMDGLDSDEQWNESGRCTTPPVGPEK